jgi:hypothetical protein
LGESPVAINIGPWTIAVKTSSTEPFILREEDDQPIYGRTLTTHMWVGVNGRALASQHVSTTVEIESAAMFETAVVGDDDDVQSEALTEA